MKSGRSTQTTQPGSWGVRFGLLEEGRGIRSQGAEPRQPPDRRPFFPPAFEPIASGGKTETGFRCVNFWRVGPCGRWAGIDRAQSSCQGIELFGHRSPRIDHLPFLEHVRELDAVEGDAGGGKGLEPPHRSDEPFDRATVLLDDVVEVLPRRISIGGSVLASSVVKAAALAPLWSMATFAGRPCWRTAFFGKRKAAFRSRCALARRYDQRAQ